MTKTSLAFCATTGAVAFRILVPETSREQERGLQDFRIGEMEGMIFLSDHWPKEQAISMWQASVPYPLAMLWIGSDNTVRFIELVQPGDRTTYSHRGVAVIELHAAVPEKYGITKGTVVMDGS